MLMLLSCKFCCLSYMTFLAAILDTVVQYLREVSVGERSIGPKSSATFSHNHWVQNALKINDGDIRQLLSGNWVI